VSEREQPDDDRMTEAVAAFAERRAVIEQAKGVLVQLLSVDADQAFAILSRYSQTHNVKVRDLAAVVIAEARHGRTPHREAREGQALAMLERLARGLGTERRASATD